MDQEKLVIHSKDDIINFVNATPNRKGGLLIIFVALGGIFIDAYDFTSIGIGNGQLKQMYHLSPFALGSITAIMALGALVGALFGGYIADKFGRNKVFLVDLLLLAVAAFGASLSTSYAVLLIFRFFMGFGVGIDMPVALSFIAEFSNLKSKGKYTNFWQPFWYIATVSAGLFDLLFYALGVGASLWRYAVGFGGVVAIVVLILRYIYMNESPMWAANNLPLGVAAKIVEKTYRIQTVIMTDKDQSPIVHKRTYSLIFSQKYRARTVIGSMISATQAMQYYAIGFYIPTISALLFGKAMINSISGTIVFNLFGILGGFVGAYLTGRWGMRKLAIWGFIVVIASLLFAGLKSGNTALVISALPIAVFIFGHSAGPGAQGKTMAANSYPTSLRPMGTGAAEAASRVGNMLGIFFFPIILAAVGLSATMLILIICPLIGLITTLVINFDPTNKDFEHEELELSSLSSGGLTAG